MIYLIYGEQTKAREKFRKIIDTFREKNPDGEIFRFDADDLDRAKLEELAQSRGLFGQKILVGCGNLLSELDLAKISDSANTFVLLEEKVPIATVREIEKCGGKVQELKSEAGKKPAFNIFALSDALGERNRKNLWLRYQEALLAGFSSEDIFWKLVWPVKTMLTVAKSKQPPENMKPFVVSKNKQFIQNYKTGELEKLSAELIALWHDSRRGLIDFDLGLEKLILSL